MTAVVSVDASRRHGGEIGGINKFRKIDGTIAAGSSCTLRVQCTDAPKEANN